MAIEYERRPLDALFISHFDNDHINGLTELLQIFGGARQAFIPYLSPVRRLMIGVRDFERGSPLDEDHKGLLDDPSAWLTSHGVEEVILVGNPGGNGEGGGTPEPPSPVSAVPRCSS